MDSIRTNLPDTLTTERLTLATPARAHVKAMAELANNKRIFEVLARLPHPYVESDGEVFVDTIARGETEHAWSILRDDSYIGVIGLHLLPGQAPELGYWLGEPHWGHGYATEAAVAVVAAARAAGYPALRSRALASNSGSRNVLRKAGFIETHEGLDPAGNNKGKPAVFMYLEFGL